MAAEVPLAPALPPGYGVSSIEIDGGDIEIGAVELKNASSDDRALIDDATAAVDSFGVVTREAPTNGTPTHTADVTVDATAGGVTLLASNAARKGAVINNTGSAAMRVSIGGTPTSSTGIQVPAGGSITLGQPYCPTGAIKAIREGAVSTTAAVLEVA